MARDQFPDPPGVPVLDSPPSDLLAEHLPELAEQHAALVKATTAAREARLRFEAAFPDRPGTLEPSGADWAAAVAADAAAVKRKHRAEQLAALIAEQAARYGDWHARSLVAAELVADWNRNAHEQVLRESRQRLHEQDAQLCAGIGEAADAAVQLATEVGARADHDARLRAAWRSLSDLDQLAEQWRPVRSLVNWVGWSRPVLHGRAWEPLQAHTWPDPMDEGGVPTTLGLALALRDAELRERFERLRPPSGSVLTR